MEAPVNRAEIARRAGVTLAAVSTALKGPLGKALTSDRKLIYPGHAAAQDYIKGSGLGRKRRQQPPRKRSTPRNGNKHAQRTNEDLVTYAARVARAGAAAADPEELGPIGKPAVEEALPPWAGEVKGSHAEWAKRYLYDVRLGIPGEFPETLEDLGKMTLQELIDRFGTISIMADLVSSMKKRADMQIKLADKDAKRGLMMPKELVRTGLMPIIELAFTRLVNEAPDAMADVIIAIVSAAISSGDTSNLRFKVAEEYRKETGGILKDCKERFAQELDG